MDCSFEAAVDHRWSRGGILAQTLFQRNVHSYELVTQASEILGPLASLQL